MNQSSNSYFKAYLKDSLKFLLQTLAKKQILQPAWKVNSAVCRVRERLAPKALGLCGDSFPPAPSALEWALGNREEWEPSDKGGIIALWWKDWVLRELPSIGSAQNLLRDFGPSWGVNTKMEVRGLVCMWTMNKVPGNSGYEHSTLSLCASVSLYMRIAAGC